MILEYSAIIVTFASVRSHSVRLKLWPKLWPVVEPAWDERGHHDFITGEPPLMAISGAAGPRVADKRHPKAEVTSSHLVGHANQIKYLPKHRRPG